jgi:hypothetical protein
MTSALAELTATASTPDGRAFATISERHSRAHVARARLLRVGER